MAICTKPLARPHPCNCEYTSNGGNIVYEAPQSGTATGTYTVESSGTSSVMLTQTSGGTGTLTINLDLADFLSNGVAATALLHTQQEGDDGLGTGIAVLK